MGFDQLAEIIKCDGFAVRLDREESVEKPHRGAGHSLQICQSRFINKPLDWFSLQLDVHQFHNISLALESFVEFLLERFRDAAQKEKELVRYVRRATKWYRTSLQPDTCLERNETIFSSLS